MDKDVLRQLAISEVSRFFSEKLVSCWKENMVPVYVEDFLLSFYFFPCNEKGYPDCDYYRFADVGGFSFNTIANEYEPPTEATITVEEVTVLIDRPIVYERFAPWNTKGKSQIFLWGGRKVDKQIVPIEQLNVKNLMQMAQRAIQKREGIILDEANKNKLYLDNE